MKFDKFEALKWLANVLYLIPMFLMLDQKMAAESTIPWIMYLVANAIWSIDSYKTRNYPWVFMSLIFIAMDIILIIQRAL